LADLFKACDQILKSYWK